MAKFSWKEKFRTLGYTYSAVSVGLLVSLAIGSTHWKTLNFWLTGLLAFTIVTLFDLFVLSILDEETNTPSRFLFRMMIMVVAIQAAFACVYHWAANDFSYLSRNGQRVNEFVDAMYFSGITLLTVGYGDVTPMGDFRFTAVAEVYGGTLFIFSFFTWGLSIIANRHFSNGKKSETNPREKERRATI